MHSVLDLVSSLYLCVQSASVTSSEGNVSGFSTQLLDLLKEKLVEPRESLNCSREALATARAAMVAAMGLGCEGVAPEVSACLCPLSALSWPGYDR